MNYYSTRPIPEIGYPKGYISGPLPPWTRTLNKSGYIYVRLPDDHWLIPFITVNYSYNRTISEHRLVMSEYLKRPLLKTENVHHKNGDKTDNRIQNLELWTTAQPSGQRINEQLHCKTCRCHLPLGAW